MGYWDDGPYDEPDEPAPCDECGGDYGEHEPWCPDAPLPVSAFKRFSRWWCARVYYRRIWLPSIHDLHCRLRGLRLKLFRPKRSPPIASDDDIPF